MARVAHRSRRRVRSELKNPPYEIFIGTLSLLSILNLVLIFVYADDEAMQLVLTVMNALFSVIFLGDFVYRLLTAPSAATYFFRHFGWADLLASLPFPHLKVLRLFRVVRVVRLMNGLGVREIGRILILDRASSALMTLLLMGVIVLQFGSLAMLGVEGRAPGANITSASDALWYTIVTISTVGYGDRYPVTSNGRLIGALIIIIGVGIFGTFTGYLANLFLGPRKSDADTAEETRAPIATSSPDRAADHAGATADGIAGGAASGAVRAGAGASALDAAEIARTAAEAASAEASLHAADGDEARVQELLARAESAVAELRAVLAARGGA